MNERPKRVRIGIVIQGLTPYWVEAIDALAVAWEPWGDISVISGGLWDSALHPWSEQAILLKNANFIHCPPLKFRHGLQTIWPGRGMWQTLGELNPDLVIIHEYAPYVVFSGLAWSKAMGRPCFVTSDVGPVQRKLLRFAQKLVHGFVNASVDGVLARTVDALDQSRISHKNALLSPHAIHTEVYSQGTSRLTNQRHPRRFIQVGSLIARKGVDLLLKAFAEACKIRPDLELVLVGSGDHQKTRRQAEALGVSDKVIIKDFMQPAALAMEYAACDVFVLASRFDSYGVVVHEAAAAALPLIVSKHAGAAATLVEEGINGYRIDPEETELFAEAMLEAANPSHYAKLSEASYQIAEHFDVSEVAQRTASWLHAAYSASTADSIKGREVPFLLFGLLRTARDAVRNTISKTQFFSGADAFGLDRRDVIFILRHLPFYREGILMRISSIWSTCVFYSGKTLGNLQSAERIESRAVSFFERNGHIVWLSTIKKLIQARPKVVCTDLSLSLYSTWFLFLLRPFLGFGLVFWTHGLQNFGWKEDRLDRKDKLRMLWIKWADAIVFYSEDRMKDVERITGDNPKYFVAPNMQETATFEALYTELISEGRSHVRSRLNITRMTLLYLGRLTVDKEVLQLAEILRLTATASQPPHLIIIGGGELKEALKDACAPYLDRVRFLGPIFDTRIRGEWIFASDLMINPGYAGLNVVDSLSMGTPFATIENRALVKRHSPEVTYLHPGGNALFAKDITSLAKAVLLYLESEHGVSSSRDAIRQSFLSSCSIENQFDGMRRAFQYVIHPNQNT